MIFYCQLDEKDVRIEDDIRQSDIEVQRITGDLGTLRGTLKTGEDSLKELQDKIDILTDEMKVRGDTQKERCRDIICMMKVWTVYNTMNIF